MIAAGRLAVVCLLLAPAAVRAQPGPGDPIDSAMDRDPELVAPRVVKTFPKGLAELWVAALDRPDAATKVSAAQSIALARRMGMTGLEAAVAPLVRELERPGQHPAARLAAAHALVALDAKQSAEALFKQLAADDPELTEAVEPALARWDFRPARATWLDRLGQGPPFRRRHLLAIESLAAVREEKAVPGLRELVMNAAVPAGVRIEAARALGAIRAAGLEADAAALAADTTPRGTGRLLAALLLRQHSGDEAVRLLQALARDADPVVAAPALARLIELDPKLVAPLFDSALTSPDANVRGHAVEALARLPGEDSVRRLTDRLNDPHPAVRARAGGALFDFAAQPALREAVIRGGVKVLAGADWRGQEQAAILLARLGHTPAAGRLVELLNTARPEAFVAAAWGLRRLAVPDTLPPVVAFVRGRHARLMDDAKARKRADSEPLDRQLSQLVQFVGAVCHRAAEPLLMEMLPRLIPGLPGNPPQTPLGPETRAAVVWALGLFHEGDPEAGLVKALEARLTDLPTPAGAEHDRVRRMAAVSLGRMGAKDAAGTLRRFYAGKPTLDPVNNACGWALERVAGERVPPPGVVEEPQLGWPLTRLE